MNTLKQLDSENIPLITILNKIDKVENELSHYEKIQFSQPCTAISALTGDGIPDLLSMISNVLFETMIPITVTLPYDQGNLISLFHENGQIDQINNDRKSTTISGRLPVRLLAQFNQWSVNLDEHEDYFDSSGKVY